MSGLLTPKSGLVQVGGGRWAGASGSVTKMRACSVQPSCRRPLVLGPADWGLGARWISAGGHWWPIGAHWCPLVVHWSLARGLPCCRSRVSEVRVQGWSLDSRGSLILLPQLQLVADKVLYRLQTTIRKSRLTQKDHLCDCPLLFHTAGHQSLSDDEGPASLDTL